MARPLPLLTASLAMLLAAPLSAEVLAPPNPVDRADPALIERELPALPQSPAQDRPTIRSAAPAASVDIDEGVMVGAVRIEGAQVLKPADFAAAIEPFIGKRLDRAGLKALADAIAAVPRGRGYAFATAWIPAQTVTSGMLTVRVDEGAIEAVRVTGADNLAVKRILGRLATGHPVTVEEVERVLLIAGDLPGITVRNASFARVGDHGVLTVAIREDRLEGRFRVDNYGSDAIGPVRARLRVDANSLFADDDRLRVEGVTVPATPREFGLISAEYNKAIGQDGADVTLAGYYASSKPSGILRTYDIAGISKEASLSSSYPLVRSRRASLWVSGTASVREVIQQQTGVPFRDDNFTNLRVGFNGFVKAGGGYLNGGVFVTQGLGVLGSTRLGDPLASRDDGSARFTKVEAYVSWNRDLTERLNLLISGEGQIASNPLLSSEEFGVGGPRYGRAYDYSERLGDQGVAGLAELRFDLGKIAQPIRRTQLYAFVDGGSTTNLGQGTGGGSLASAGGGIRMWFTHGLSASIEAAAPLTGPRFATGDRSPRISFTLGADF